MGNATQQMGHWGDQSSSWGGGRTRDHWAAPNVANRTRAVLSLGAECRRGVADRGGGGAVTWKLCGVMILPLAH